MCACAWDLGGEIWRQCFGSCQSFDQEHLPVTEPVQNAYIHTHTHTYPFSSQSDFTMEVCAAEHLKTSEPVGPWRVSLTLRGGQRFSSCSTPANRVDVWNTQVQPEISGGVAVEAFVSQQGLKPWKHVREASVNMWIVCIETKQRSHRKWRVIGSVYQPVWWFQRSSRPSWADRCRCSAPPPGVLQRCRPTTSPSTPRNRNKNDFTFIRVFANRQSQKEVNKPIDK